MNVNVLNAYSNPYSSSLSENLASNGITVKDNEIKGGNRENVAKQANVNSENLLTKKERSFFKQLFPENSEQIDKHVLFNRNGKIQNAPSIKGAIFDGRF